MNSSSYVTGAEIDEVFDHFDTENAGVLSNPETIKQAVYSTGCAPTLGELDSVLAQALAESAANEDEGGGTQAEAAGAAPGLTKKAFKALMLQMQRSVPREQEVLQDLETLRGAVSPESFTAAAFENVMRNVGDKLTDVEASNFATLVHAHLDASAMIDQYSLTHTMLHFQDTELEAETFSQ